MAPAYGRETTPSKDKNDPHDTGKWPQPIGKTTPSRGENDPHDKGKWPQPMGETTPNRGEHDPHDKGKWPQPMGKTTPSRGEHDPHDKGKWPQPMGKTTPGFCLFDQLICLFDRAMARSNKAIASVSTSPQPRLNQMEYCRKSHHHIPPPVHTNTHVPGGGGHGLAEPICFTYVIEIYETLFFFTKAKPQTPNPTL